jgi:hypothetical protein
VPSSTPLGQGTNPARAGPPRVINLAGHPRAAASVGRRADLARDADAAGISTSGASTTFTHGEVSPKSIYLALASRSRAPATSSGCG